jgi:hypothetical protein
VATLADWSAAMSGTRATGRWRCRWRRRRRGTGRSTRGATLADWSAATWGTCRRRCRGPVGGDGGDW